MLFVIFYLLNEWSPDAVIFEGYTSYPNQHNIVCDVAGGAHAVWYKFEGGARYSVWYNYYTGAQWTTAQQISTYSVFACHPSIATWMNDIYCVWENNWGYSDIVLRRFLGGNWEDTVIVVSRGTKHTYTPSAVCDFQGVLHIVWEKGYEIHYRNLYGSVFSNDTVLSNSGVYAAYPTIGTFNDKIFVVWEDLRDGNFEIYFKEFNGNQWSEDIRATNSADASLFPSLCVDSSGVAHIVWQEDGVEGFKIFYTSYEQGNFSPTTLIVDSPGEAITPSITTAGDELHLAWSDSRDGDWEIYYKIKAQKSNSKNGWGEDTRLTNSLGRAANPSICASDVGNLYLLFWDTRILPAKVYFKKNSTPKDKKQSLPELTVSPNPFTHTTVMRVRGEPPARITIYDVGGRIVKSWDLGFSPETSSGSDFHEVVWDGRDDRGVKLNSGVYFVHVVAQNNVGNRHACSLRQKIILIRGSTSK